MRRSWLNTLSAADLRRCSLFALALILTSCSSTPRPLGERASANAPRGNADLIVRAELDTYSGQGAREVVERLRPNWLRGRGTSSRAGPSSVRVVVDGTSRRELQDLNFIRSDEIESIRRLSAADATTEYGTGFLDGALEVATRRGG
jgi:hypothetical protein